MKKLLLSAIAIILLAIGMFYNENTTSAVSANDWQAGEIVSDNAFTDANSMSVQEIQNFLKQRLPFCDKNGSRTSELGGGTRAQYAASRGNPAPFTCITEYYEVPKTAPGNFIPANNYGRYNADGSPYIPPGAKSAAEIISIAAKKYSISPKTLLIKVATESAGPLTGDQWPLKTQYYYAMGARCPDSGPGGSASCDANYSGFSIQIDEAAKLLRGYLDNMGASWWRYRKPYQNNQILWNVVERGCGSGNVYIKSKATAALYTYTPYQPNRAALNNMYGTGDNCSAYGNRNFWRVWNDWFGSTSGNKFTPMLEARYMQLSQNTTKIDPSTGNAVDGVLPAGLQVYFVNKTKSPQGSCAQTQNDATHNFKKCIPLNRLQEITITYQNTSPQERTQTTNKVLYKKEFRTNKSVSAFPIDNARIVNFPKKTVVKGITYYLTNFDSANNTESGIPSTDLRQTNNFTPMTKYWARLVSDTSKATGPTATSIDGVLPEGLVASFESKTNIGGIDYYRTSHDTSNGYDKAISTKSLDDPYRTFVQPRWMKLNSNTTETDPFTNQAGRSLTKNTDVFIDSKLSFKGSAFYRERSNTAADKQISIPAGNLSEIDYRDFVQPRWLNIDTKTETENPLQGTKNGKYLDVDTQHYFKSKISVNGKQYYKDDKGNTILASNTSEVSYRPFVSPRIMRVNKSATKYIPSTGQADMSVNQGALIKFVAKVKVGDRQYFQTQHDSVNGFNRAMLSTDLSEY